MSDEARLTEIRSLMTSDPDTYWKPETQAAEVALIAARQSGTAASVSPQTAPNHELASIQKTIEREPHKYWGDKALQDRHLALIEERDGKKGAASDDPIDATPMPGTAELVPASPDEFRKEVSKSEAGAALLADWDGGREDYSTALTRTQNIANRFVNLLPGSSRGPVMESFDRLPDSARFAVFAEVSRPAPAGADAKQIIEQRLTRTYERLDTASASMLANWIDGLDPSSMRAVAKVLAG